MIGALVTGALEGSLLVLLLFSVDAFMSPQMTSSGALAWTPTRGAGELLIAAGAGQGSPGAHWVEMAAVAACSLAVALGAFWTAARTRS